VMKSRKQATKKASSKKQVIETKAAKKAPETPAPAPIPQSGTQDAPAPAKAIPPGGAKAAKKAAPAAEQSRHGSKKAAMLELMGRNDGATVRELMAATDWLPHSTRGAISDSAPGPGIRPTASAPQLEWQRPAGIAAGPVHPKREQPPAGALGVLRAKVCQGCR